MDQGPTTEAKMLPFQRHVWSFFQPNKCMNRMTSVCDFIYGSNACQQFFVIKRSTWIHFNWKCFSSCDGLQNVNRSKWQCFIFHTLWNQRSHQIFFCSIVIIISLARRWPDTGFNPARCQNYSCSSCLFY